MELSNQKPEDKNKMMRIHKEARIYLLVEEVEVVSGVAVAVSFVEHHTLDSLTDKLASVKL